MSISLSTALEIQGNDDVLVDAAGPNDEGKWSGWITHGPRRYCRPILTTQFIYGSKEAAVEDMTEVLKQVREMDLSNNLPQVTTENSNGQSKSPDSHDTD